MVGFNPQPPEGGCDEKDLDDVDTNAVSTHSHPKVAAKKTADTIAENVVSTHSHPKVAASFFLPLHLKYQVSTHSHPKVAANIRFFSVATVWMFQHTATRRWLQ